MAKTLFDTKIDIVDLEFPNKGVGYFGEENKKVTVKNTIPGQTVIADVKKKERILKADSEVLRKKLNTKLNQPVRILGFVVAVLIRIFHMSRN